jgi:hypothetical protein
LGPDHNGRVWGQIVLGDRLAHWLGYRLSRVFFLRSAHRTFRLTRSSQGPEYLIRPTLAATTRIVFAANSPLQEAMAVAFEKAEEARFFETQREEYVERRAVLTEALDRLGLP